MCPWSYPDAKTVAAAEDDGGGDFALRQVGVVLEHAQHPVVGVFLQLGSAGGHGGRGGVGSALGRLPQCARCFAAVQMGVFRGSWRGVAGMTVRKRTILVVVCGLGVVRYMFFCHGPGRRLSLWEPIPVGDCL